MRVVFISPSTLNYKGRTHVQGDELEVTEAFYNNHLTRFKKLDDNLVVDAEFVEIKNVVPEKKKGKKGKKSK